MLSDERIAEIEAWVSQMSCCLKRCNKDISWLVDKGEMRGIISNVQTLLAERRELLAWLDEWGKYAGLLAAHSIGRVGEELLIMGKVTHAER